MAERDIIIKYGIIMFIGFLVFFIFMKFLSLVSNTNLRILNGFIHLPLVYLAIREYKKRIPLEQFTYFSGSMIGVKASLIGVGAFALYQMVFLYLDGAMMGFIIENAFAGAKNYLTPFTISLYLFLEGMIASMLVSYIAMRIVDMQKKIVPAT